jgi:hypothetical protein
MMERGRAFDEAKSRLPLDQQKALLFDQKGWVASYPQACGVARDVAPLPLAPAIKDCMARAGRARIAYLRGYDLPAAGNLTPEAPTARPAAANEAQFAQGLRDRTAWEDWFNGLSGDERAGASFWAAERSRPNPGDCLGTAVFIQGCQEAKAKLAGSDPQRKTQPAYRFGWNSYVRPAAPQAAAAPPPPAPHAGGSPPATPRSKAPVWSPASPWLPALSRTAETKNSPPPSAPAFEGSVAHFVEPTFETTSRPTASFPPTVAKAPPLSAEAPLPKPPTNIDVAKYLERKKRQIDALSVSDGCREQLTKVFVTPEMGRAILQNNDMAAVDKRLLASLSPTCWMEFETDPKGPLGSLLPKYRAEMENKLAAWSLSEECREELIKTTMNLQIERTILQEVKAKDDTMKLIASMLTRLSPACRTEIAADPTGPLKNLPVSNECKSKIIDLMINPATVHAYDSGDNMGLVLMLLSHVDMPCLAEFATATGMTQNLTDDRMRGHAKDDKAPVTGGVGDADQPEFRPAERKDLDRLIENAR